MCELFGMSSRYPTTIKFSLKAFEDHWKKPKQKADGWGITFSRGNDFLLVKEPVPAGQSETLHFFENNTFRSSLVISHLRRAGRGAKRSFVNTQPFAKDLFGTKFVFAHNGFVPQVFRDKSFRLTYFKPLGKTDSEYIFCFLLDRIKERLGERQSYAPDTVARLLSYYALKINKLGTFNFLMSDSKHLYAFRSSKLYSAQRDCVCRQESFKGGPLSIRMGPACPTKNQQVALIATEPLTKDRCWDPLTLRKVEVFYNGKRIN
jgi:glutamine amidotransferase